MFEKNTDKDFIAIYIAPVNEISLKGVWFPVWRRKECKNDGFNRYPESRLVWGLLDYAVKDCLGVKLNTLKPHKLLTGKLVLDKYFVSLSHSGKYMMVGLSNKSIGVDVQKAREGACSSFMNNRKSIWNEKERKLIDDNMQDPFFGIVYWTRKEALYKFLDPGISFEDNRPMFDTIKYSDCFISGTIDDKRAYFSVCSELVKNGIEIVIKSNIVDKEIK